MALPINHLKRTLDRCCGQWEFDRETNGSSRFYVRFPNTGRLFFINNEYGWEAHEVFEDGTQVLDQRLTGILNGHTRDDAGNLPSDFACVPGVE